MTWHLPLRALLVGAMISSASMALPQQVQLVSYQELEPELVALIDFESLPKVPSPGRALDDVTVFDGARIAERFRGQIVAQDAGFDRLILDPEPPLALVPGPPGENLAIEFVYFLSNLMMGTAPPGFPDRHGGGEGAMSILFDRDQSALGFRVASEPKPKEPAPKGQMTVSFYRRDGTLIDRLDVELEWMLGAYGFVRTNQAADIAGISITNKDLQGIMIDDVIFDRSVILSRLGQ